MTTPATRNSKPHPLHPTNHTPRGWSARTWTPEQDATIVHMCGEPGMKWQWIADALGIKRATVIKHAHVKLGCSLALKPVEKPARVARTQDVYRGALPAGDARTWGLISGGCAWVGMGR